MHTLLIYFRKKTKQILVILILQTDAKLLVCSESGHPLGAAESTAFSSWSVNYLSDCWQMKMLGSQDLLINHSLEGLEGNHRQALEPLKSSVSLAGVQLAGLVLQNAFPQCIIQLPCVQTLSPLVTRLPLTNLPSKLQNTPTWTDDVTKSRLISRWCL